MKKNLLAVVLFIAVFITSGYGQSLAINEVITSNSSVLTDDDGSYEDWIELYNGTSESINLNGYGLTDNTNLYQWVFPAKVIAPGEYLLVWCSDKNRTNPDNPLHTNFKISSGGETIVLTDNEGYNIDTVVVGVIPQNYTYGRSPDGTSEFKIFPEPTPGSANITTGYSEILEEPALSVPAGFYTDSFNLSIISTAPGATIIYTLDGSEPDENNLSGTTYQYKNQYPANVGDPYGPLLQQNYASYVYNTPLVIDDRSAEPNDISTIATSFYFNTDYLQTQPVPKGTVVRAKAIKPGAMASPIVTANYFVSPQGDNWFSLPVAAISVDEDSFFDYNQGIYVPGVDFDEWREDNPTNITDFANANYHRSGDDWEVRGNFTYFHNNQEVVNQDVGLRINGNMSSMAPLKSLRLVARSSYGKGSMDYNFFGENYDSYKRLILRNSGNDYYLTLFRDALIHTSVSHLNFETQAYQPTATFINGEYWGILNMRERYDKHLFKRVFGIEEDELDYLENGEVKEGDNLHYNALFNYLSNNSLTPAPNYDYVTTQLDPVNFADYQIAQIYVNNKDWPANNVEYFRKRTAAYVPNAPAGQDGRWRWILKDADFGLGFGGPYTDNTLQFATATDGPEWPNPAWSTLFLRKMLENDQFKTYFINRFADLMNTTFLPERMLPIYNNLRNTIAPEMGRHRARWNYFGDETAWNAACATMSTFIQERPAYQRTHIREKFNISSNITATLDVSDAAHGHVKINTIDIKDTTVGVPTNPYPWQGIYFHNIPVTLSAVAAPGYKFSHWSGDVTGTEPQITYNPTENFEVVANFVPDATNIALSPVYFWLFDNNVANDTPLTGITATYPEASAAVLNFESCLTGYPFTEGHTNWRKASMERRNSPTDINYMPEANNDIPFASVNMRGIQIKQPFIADGNENIMVFTLPTSGYENIVFNFAAKDEGAATGIAVEYSLTETPSWTAFAAQPSTLTNAYQLFTADFSDIEGAENNPHFKVRLRFTGTTTADNGDRVTFNNIGLMGTPLLPAGITTQESLSFYIYPNPFDDNVYIAHQYERLEYSVYTIDGKLVKSGTVTGNPVNLAQLQSGIYLMQLTADNKTITKKIVKR